MILLALGCAEPISNALLLEDERYLAALPSATRIGFSPNWAGRVVDDSTDPLFAAALDEARALDPLLTVPSTLGDLLRSSDPDGRGDTLRSWDARAVSAPTGAGVDGWWVRAEVTSPLGGGALAWWIDGARDAEGPWERVGGGRHDPSGFGSFTWDLSATAALVDLPWEGLLELDVEGADAERIARIRLLADRALPREFSLIGAERFAWAGPLALSADGVAEPGAAVVGLLADGSGRGEGVLLRGADEVPFAACWGPDGARLWSDGGADLPQTGDPAACPALPL